MIDREERMMELEENLEEENAKVKEILKSDDPDLKPLFKIKAEEFLKLEESRKKELEEKAKTERANYKKGESLPIADLIKHRKEAEEARAKKVEELEKKRQDKLKEDQKRVSEAYSKINEIHANKKDNTALELNVEKLKQEAKIAKMKELVAS